MLDPDVLGDLWVLQHRMNKELNTLTAWAEQHMMDPGVNMSVWLGTLSALRRSLDYWESSVDLSPPKPRRLRFQ